MPATPPTWGRSQTRSYIRWTARAKLVAEKQRDQQADQPGLGTHLVRRRRSSCTISLVSAVDADQLAEPLERSAPSARSAGRRPAPRAPAPAPASPGRRSPWTRSISSIRTRPSMMLRTTGTLAPAPAARTRSRACIERPDSGERHRCCLPVSAADRHGSVSTSVAAGRPRDPSPLTGEPVGS